ncbi:uncharacterized protein BDW70DRAFT_169385 [Aspergillus foveolatus]|uniref:uncharacterized protein n=1 Tax=Aspergillus foveolatus TaxID=210207 RepID=UPI003CCCFF20
MDAKNVVTYKAIKPQQASPARVQPQAAHVIFFLFSLSFFFSGLQQRYPTEQHCAAQLSAYLRQIKVEPNDLTHLKEPPTQAKLRTTDGEWYTGGLEVFHKVHCVSHCIDMLRQVVQCHGDVGIVAVSWVEGFPDPYPDFNTWHKCRKFQPLNDYTQQYLLTEKVVKTSEDLTLPRPPCENAGPQDICP